MHATSRVLAGIATAGLFCSIVSAAMLLGPQQSASASPVAVQGWGSQGEYSSSSPVTVRWDNARNSAENTVPRDKTAVLPHTGGATYDDIDPAVTSLYTNRFGAQNGKGGLEVSVSQTRELVNQSVTVSVSGAVPDPSDFLPFFQVFQCWGAPGSDGKPDPDATAPDPETCQVGAEGADASPKLRTENTRAIYADPLIAKGDWKTTDEFTPGAPFRAVDGTRIRTEAIHDVESNTYFSGKTTNELSLLTAQRDGTGDRLMEMQTGSEAPGLGCGYRADTASTSTCWIVVVPRLRGTDDTSTQLLLSGPVAPSLWAQRLQIKLDFSDVAASCPNGRAQVLTAGSEMLTRAMASWIPAVCSASQVSLGYSQLGDSQARLQLGTGALQAVFSSRPPDDPTSAISMPVATTGVVIAATIDYRPRCGGPGFDADTITEAQATGQCGYPDLSTAQREIRKYGTLMTGIKLNARLVAKLLTESYRAGIDDESGNQLATKAPWAMALTANLGTDPEFRALNPELQYAVDFSFGTRSGDLMVENLRSDAAEALWEWIHADDNARSFLDGCPDPYGSTVNPFYSTRSYKECVVDAPHLEADAKAKRDATELPKFFVDAPAVYPPDSASYPQLSWYQRDPVGVFTAQTLNDLHPRSDTMATTGRNTFRAIYPANTDWCDPLSDSRCAVAGWLSPKTPQDVGSRTVISITDASTAARYQLPTAELCSYDGGACVSANAGSLAKAASRFEQDPTGVGPMTVDDYQAGLYPLALPIYAQVARASLTPVTASAFADSFTYLTGDGQRTDGTSGSLPVGYASLTSAQSAQAASAIAELRGAQSVPSAAPSSAAPTPQTAAPVAAPAAAAAPAAPRAAAPVVTTASTAPVAAADAPVAALPATTTTGRTEIGFPQYGLVGGLVAALASGILAPVLGRRRKAAAE
ncbi:MULTISPECIES: hypothetical protein [unclassified Rathayibacter]|uniref:hypothetical protein n=1 Tax=unclassified Rathayibacter TaxID=2609250 RepID=UPI001889FA6F|nr:MULTISPECIES: hypothetical protein [unclassified Rathayibacter]MBF4462739.1 hypothetical protein [Rathayibacter sp. VKM Ac-2879]MBF4504153.1 hypothetical protein [Rathayibacter sp. VKM Ac-2878]